MKASNFGVCLTKGREVDCHLFATCWLVLRPQCGWESGKYSNQDWGGVRFNDSYSIKNAARGDFANPGTAYLTQSPITHVLLNAVGNQPILRYINCPMFGFQSILSTVCYRIHKGIIWTSTLCILVSLFDTASLFDTSSLIDTFLRLSPIYWLVCLQRSENYSQLSYNLFHPYSIY